MNNKVQHPGAVVREVMNRLMKKTKGACAYRIVGYHGLPNTICCVFGFYHILFLIQWCKTVWPIEFREYFSTAYSYSWSEPYVCDTPDRLKLLISIKLEEEEKFIKEYVRNYYYTLNYIRKAENKNIAECLRQRYVDLNSISEKWR